jgi:hypothetical protein
MADCFSFKIEAMTTLLVLRHSMTVPLLCHRNHQPNRLMPARIEDMLIHPTILIGLVVRCHRWLAMRSNRAQQPGRLVMHFFDVTDDTPGPT